MIAGDDRAEGRPDDPADDDAAERTSASTVTGVVTAQLPSGLYQVEVGEHRVTAHIGGGLGRNFVRVLIGDRVAVELMPRDRSRGRIVRKSQP